MVYCCVVACCVMVVVLMCSFEGVVCVCLFGGFGVAFCWFCGWFACLCWCVACCLCPRLLIVPFLFYVLVV